MKGEVAIEPLGVGYSHKSLDEVLHPIIAIDVGACQNTVCALKFLYFCGEFPMEKLAPANLILTLRHLPKGWGPIARGGQVGHLHLPSME
jgi:hypothetical protein